MAVFHRATRIARSLFAGSDSLIILVQDGVAWRSRFRDRVMSEGDSVAEAALSAEGLTWVEDSRLHPVLKYDRLAVGPPYLRSWIGAPIRLEDGSTPGILCVVSTSPQPYDAHKAARLGDLADFVADEWVRARAAKAQSEAAEALHTARSTLAALAAAMPISLVMTDASLRVVAASRLWRQALELGDAEAVGRPLFELSPIYEEWREPLNRALSGEPVEGAPLAMRRPDGSVAWMQMEVTAWRRGDGEVGGLVISAHDVSQLMDALESAERAEDRLNLALNLADVHVWEIDYVRRRLFKAGAEDTFFERPLTYDEMFRDIYATIDARDREMVRESWRRHTEEGAPHNPQYRIARGDGREVWGQTAIRFFEGENGRPLRLVGAIRNITEAKRAEQALVRAMEGAEAANRAKSTFLATMSHEIRTPLNGVLGMAQAMAADDLTEPQRSRLDVIRQSGESLLVLLNDVLDLSKVEAGKLELESAPFDIVELARAVEAAFRGAAEAKGIGFSLAVAKAARGLYLGDQTRVRQILGNLVSNAIKFTETGEVRIAIGMGAQGLSIRVRDTGIGIAKDRLGQVFFKFEQADASTTRRFGGTGLGLAICRELVELMGGQVKLASKVGVGTTFTVTLPLQRLEAGDAPAAIAPDIAAASPGEGPPLRVLAAEDNAVNRLVLRALLSQAGVEPLIVEDGRAAVDAWECADWDVVLMDMQMPVMDGAAATNAIRRREAETRRPRTPILALTADVMSHQIASYLAAGMDGFVAKPIEVKALFEALDAALRPVDFPSPLAGEGGREAVG